MSTNVSGRFITFCLARHSHLLLEPKIWVIFATHEHFSKGLKTEKALSLVGCAINEIQRVLALCDFWDLEKVALAKNCIRQIDRSNEMNMT